MALGAALALGGLGWDGVRGHEGRLRLRPGQASQNFVEQGPGGASLGLRPLGFQAVLEQLREDVARLSLGGQEVVVTPTRAAAFGGVRLGRPRVAAPSHLANTAHRVAGIRAASLTRLRTRDLLTRFAQGRFRSRA